MYEKRNYRDYYEKSYNNRWHTINEYKRYSNICEEIPLKESEDPLDKQLDRLNKDGKLNGRVKSLPKRYLLTRRVA